MLDAVWLPLLVKIAATVAFVLAASAAVERGGPYWGGLFCALPLGAGPGYVLLALQSDADFVAASALSSLSGNMATVVFMFAVVRLAPRWPVVPTLAGAVVCWALTVALVRPIAWTSTTVLLANCAVLVAVCLLSRGVTSDAPAPAVDRSWLDLPIRALLIGCVVAGVVSLSHALGPGVTGIALVFPMAVGSLTAVLHARAGGRAVAATMATGLRAMPGFTLALLVVHLAVPFGLTLGLLAGLASSLAWAAAMMAWRAYAPPVAV